MFVLAIGQFYMGKLTAISSPPIRFIHYNTLHLVSQGSKDTTDGRQIGRGNSFALEGSLGLLLGVVSLFLDLSLGLQLGDQVSVAPSDLLGELAQDGEVAVSAKSQGLQGGGHNNTLLLVIRLGDTLEAL